MKSPIIDARMIRTRLRFDDGDWIKQYGWRAAFEFDHPDDHPRARPAAYRVRCGFGHTWGTGSPCAGDLGIASPIRERWSELLGQIEQDAIRNGWHDHFRELERSGAWFIEHSERLRRDPDSVYRVMRGRAVGRRPLPASMRRPGWESEMYDLIPERRPPLDELVGDLAVLPLIIECPDCHRPNRVTLPEST